MFHVKQNQKTIDIQTISRDFNLKLKDYFLSGEEFELKINKVYGFLETHPQPLENLSKYYETDEYISHTDSEKGLFAKAYQIVKNYNLKYKFSKLENIKEGSSILDYGCGTGDFLVYAKERNLKIRGVEPNSQALKLASKKLGESVVSNLSIEELDMKFDVITLWHVLEHISDLYPFIENLKSKLNPGGKIYVAVPNHLSYDAKFYGKYWAAYDVPRHLWHFSPQSLEKIFNSFGMKIEKQYPLWFDSYYVSLLSEKYKKTKLGFLRAILIASLSNLKGIFSKNYSSIIYQITKTENKEI